MDAPEKRGGIEVSVSHRFIRPLSTAHLTLLYAERSEGSGLAADEVLLLSPYEAVAAARLEGARYWSVSFAPETVVASERGSVYFYWLCNPLFFSFVNTKGAPLRVSPRERSTWVEQLLRLEREASSQDVGAADAAKALLTLLLVDAARLAAVVSGAATLEVQPLLARVFDMIEARFREPLSLAGVAGALHLTPPYLTTLVREASGRTVNGWIAERRMAEARRLLHPSVLRGAVLFRPMVPLEPDALPDLSGVPVLLSAGRRDPIVPVGNVERLAEMLKDAGAEVTLHWQDAGHGLLDHEIREAKRWLSERRR